MEIENLQITISSIILGVLLLAVGMIAISTLNTGQDYVPSSVSMEEWGVGAAKASYTYGFSPIYTDTLVVTNQTGAGSIVIGSGNYTATSTAIVLTTAGNTTYNGFKFGLSYQYGGERSMNATMNEMNSNLSSIVDWIPLIILGICVSIVVTLLFRRMFGNNQ